MTDLADRQRAVAQIGAEIATPQDLWEAYEVLAEYEAALVAAGRRLHAQGYSYTALAAPFGITRQGALKRWGPAGPEDFYTPAAGDADRYNEHSQPSGACDPGAAP